MPMFAVRAVEPWSGPSIFVGVVLLVIAIGALYWALRRYLDGS